MIPNELRKLIADLSYKPGWVFKLRADNFNVDTMFIETLQIDADDFSKTITVNFGKAIPQGVTDGFDWLGWVRHAIIEFETHDVDEFLRVNGKKPFYPH